MHTGLTDVSARQGVCPSDHDEVTGFESVCVGAAGLLSRLLTLAPLPGVLDLLMHYVEGGGDAVTVLVHLFHASFNGFTVLEVVASPKDQVQGHVGRAARHNFDRAPVAQALAWAVVHGILQQ